MFIASCSITIKTRTPTMRQSRCCCERPAPPVVIQCERPVPVRAEACASNSASTQFNHHSIMSKFVVHWRLILFVDHCIQDTQLDNNFDTLGLCSVVAACSSLQLHARQREHAVTSDTSAVLHACMHACMHWHVPKYSLQAHQRSRRRRRGWPPSR
jgi:hypothetical protein